MLLSLTDTALSYSSYVSLDHREQDKDEGCCLLHLAQNFLEGKFSLPRVIGWLARDSQSYPCRFCAGERGSPDLLPNHTTASTQAETTATFPTTTSAGLTPFSLLANYFQSTLNPSIYRSRRILLNWLNPTDSTLRTSRFRTPPRETSKRPQQQPNLFMLVVLSFSPAINDATHQIQYRKSNFPPAKARLFRHSNSPKFSPPDLVPV